MNDEEVKKLEGLVRLVGISAAELDALVQRVAGMSDDELASEISGLEEKIKADEALIKRLQDEVNEAEREMRQRWRAKLKGSTAHKEADNLGGKRRAERLTPEQRSTIARKAAAARWAKRKRG